MICSTQSSFDQKDVVLVCPIVMVKKKPILTHLPAKLKKMVEKRIKNKDFKAEAGKVDIFEPAMPRSSKVVLLIGLGEEKDLKNETVRNAIASATKLAKRMEKKEMTIVLTEQMEEYMQVMGEAVSMANYLLGKNKTGKELTKLKKKLLSKVKLSTKSKEARTLKGAFEKGLLIGDAVNATRDMINAPSNILNPKTFEEEARNIAKEHKYKIKVFKKKELQKMGLKALLAVNAGAKEECQQVRMIMVEHMPVKGQKPIAIVGKGIIFDTGGYNLKPSRHIENMQYDMSGAAVVMGVFRLLKELDIQQNVVGLVGLTENLVSDTAYKPADIIETYAGKTIEITNTDAEGRVILCDLLHYAHKDIEAKSIIDIATLTGACVVALADRYAGMMGTDKKTMEALKESGKRTDDLVWELPIHDDFGERMKSKLADLHNSQSGYGGGAQTAGAFLKNFVGKTPWTHLDIAGTASTDHPKKYEYPRGTGFGVRLLVDYLEHLGEKQEAA